MRIAENVEMIEIDSTTGTFFPILLWDDSDVILVDTGLPETRESLINQIKKAGFDPLDITKVILTHQDLDHIGNARFFAGHRAKIYASRTEAPYIEGKEKLVKLALLEEKQGKRDALEERIYTVIRENIPHCTVPVNVLLEDGDVLASCGGIDVICTKGHTPGHISLLLQKHNILIAGDAAIICENHPKAPHPDFCSNPEQAMHAFQKIDAMQWDGIACYHSGFLKKQKHAAAIKEKEAL